MSIRQSSGIIGSHSGNPLTGETAIAFGSLPDELVSELTQAVQSGRYMVMVVRLDSTKGNLEMYRQTINMPEEDNETIVAMLRENLASSEHRTSGPD